MTRRPLTSLLWGFMLALCLCWLLCGCSPRTVTVTDYQRDTLWRDRQAVALRSDTVVRIDSVAVIQRGDTVYQTRWRTLYKTSQRTDTVRAVQYRTRYADKVRTVKEPYTPWWVGCLAFIGAAFLLLLAYFWILKLKNIIRK